MQSVIWVLWKYSKGFKCGIGSSAPPRRPSWSRGRTLIRSFWAAVASHPLWSSDRCDFPALICQRLEGHSCSLGLCWFACKGGIHRLLSQDQMSSWGSNRLALSILWSPWVCQCDLGSGLQHLGLCYRYSLLWETSQMGLKANLAMTSLLTWASLVAKLIKNPPAMQEIWVWTVGW